MPIRAKTYKADRSELYFVLPSFVLFASSFDKSTPNVPRLEYAEKRIIIMFPYQNILANTFD